MPKKMKVKARAKARKPRDIPGLIEVDCDWEHSGPWAYVSEGGIGPGNVQMVIRWLEAFASWADAQAKGPSK